MLFWLVACIPLLCPGSVSRKKRYEKCFQRKEKLAKWAFPSLVSGATDGVVKNMPAGQSSPPITLVPTRDSSNLKHWGSCTMELQFVNLLSLTLIWCINHDNRQACSNCCRLLSPSKQAELDQEVQIWKNLYISVWKAPTFSVLKYCISPRTVFQRKSRKQSEERWSLISELFSVPGL